MKSTQIIAIVAVAVIAVAGVTTFLVLNDDSGDKTERIHIDTQLAVYGNANNDYNIDEKDRDIIQDIIDGKKSFADYPLADADRSGSIDSADLDIVNNVIAGKKTTLRIIDQIDRIVKVEYPMDNVIAVSSDICTFMACSGFSDTVAGMVSSNIYANIY